MPYGFIKHIENKGYSSETIRSYEKVLSQFFSYINHTYPTNKEPFQISPIDIKNYLEEQHEKDKSITTINKELAIIKTLFHYLWEIDKVPVDPAVKLKRYKVKDKLNIEVTYEEIIDILQKVLHDDEYSILRKAIFLLAVKGLKTQDFRFKKDEVIVSKNKTEIKLKNRTISLDGTEAEIFKSYFEDSLSNGSEYAFITKTQGQEIGGPIQVMSILYHLRAISDDYLSDDVQSFTLISIRRAIAYYLYKKRYSIQMIAKELGIEENTASNYLKAIMEGMLFNKTNKVL